MNSGLQKRYLEEVLGLQPPFGVPSVPQLPVVVECEPLSPETESLLNKILSTIPLADCPRFETGSEPLASRHRLQFVGLGGRKEEGGTVHWQLPKLSEMAGSGPQVTELKKSAWALLRQFIQERPV